MELFVFPVIGVDKAVVNVVDIGYNRKEREKKEEGSWNKGTNPNSISS